MPGAAGKAYAAAYARQSPGRRCTLCYIGNLGTEVRALNISTQRQPRQDWYSISVEALRGWIIFCSVTALSVVAFFGWRAWERYALVHEAETVLEEARGLLQQVDKLDDISDYRDAYGDARNSFDQAKQSFSEDDFPATVENGRKAANLLRSILNELQDQGLVSEAHFLTVTGTVEFRRGEHGDWEEARARVGLRDGYYVRTAANGSAEVMFADGTLYRVRSDTLVQIHRGRSSGSADRTIRMQYGALDLSTSRNSSRIQTPSAAAEVQEASSATVTYDEDRKSARFAAFSGGMQVSGGGQTREVTALQEVQQRGDRLGEVRKLPRPPDLVGPQDNYEVDLQPEGKLVLTWQPVYGARNYVLQVSRQRLFADTVIEDTQRSSTRATLGIRGEGTFLWRVAAVNQDGSQGPWSAVRKFRIASSSERNREDDREPPQLVLKSTQQYGSIYIVEGSTEPGADVTIRGESVQVGADGSFKTTLQLYDEGWNFVEIRAKDTYGNETVRPLRLYVDSI